MFIADLKMQRRPNEVTPRRREDTPPPHSAPQSIPPRDDDSPNAFFFGTGGCYSTDDDPSGLFQHFWQSPKSEDAFPVAREGHSADVIGCSQVYMFGGWDGKATTNDLHVLELEADKIAWRQLRVSDAPLRRRNVRDLKREIFYLLGHKTCVCLKKIVVYLMELEHTCVNIMVVLGVYV